jgi:Cu+-exporting ATPase
MSVTIAGAKHTAEVGGVTYYFCCGGCRKRFLDDPRAFGAGA